MDPIRWFMDWAVDLEERISWTFRMMRELGKLKVTKATCFWPRLRKLEALTPEDWTLAMDWISRWEARRGKT